MIYHVLRLNALTTSCETEIIDTDTILEPPKFFFVLSIVFPALTEDEGIDDETERA